MPTADAMPAWMDCLSKNYAPHPCHVCIICSCSLHLLLSQHGQSHGASKGTHAAHFILIVPLAPLACSTLTQQPLPHHCTPQLDSHRHITMCPDLTATATSLRAPTQQLPPHHCLHTAHASPARRFSACCCGGS
jgi:hypothetical protein